MGRDDGLVRSGKGHWEWEGDWGVDAWLTGAWVDDVRMDGLVVVD